MSSNDTHDEATPTAPDFEVAPVEVIARKREPPAEPDDVAPPRSGRAWLCVGAIVILAAGLAAVLAH